MRQTNEGVQQQWITRQKRRGREGNRNRARRQKLLLLLLLLSSKDYENCVKTHEGRKSGTKKNKEKNGNQQANTRDRNKTIATKAREMQKVEQMRGASEAREGEKQNESNERARARGEREGERRGSLVPAN